VFCSENLCAGGTLECGSDAAALEFWQKGGSWRYRTPRRFAHFHGFWVPVSNRV